MQLKIITLSFILTFFFLGHSQTLTDSLKAYYPFNNNALDESGNGNNGLVNAASLTTDRFGNTNSAYEFNGTSSYISLTNEFDYPERSVNLWVYPTSTSTDQLHVFISDNPSMSNGFTQIINTIVGGDTVLRTSAGLVSGVALNSFSLNTWHMITVTVCTDSVRHYFDGDLVGVTAKATVNSQDGHPTALLGTSRKLDRYFEGKIDDVRIYNRCISSTEVSDLFDEITGITSHLQNEIDFSIHPNPTSYQLNIKFNDLKDNDYEVRMYNTKGQNIIMLNGNSSNQLEINTAELVNGLYFIHIILENNVTLVSKISVE